MESIEQEININHTTDIISEENTNNDILGDMYDNMFKDTTDDVYDDVYDDLYDDMFEDTTDDVVEDTTHDNTDKKPEITINITIPKINIQQVNTLTTCIKDFCTTETTKTTYNGDDTVMETVQESPEMVYKPYERSPMKIWANENPVKFITGSMVLGYVFGRGIFDVGTNVSTTFSNVVKSRAQSPTFANPSNYRRFMKVLRRK